MKKIISVIAAIIVLLNCSTVMAAQQPVAPSPTTITSVEGIEGGFTVKWHKVSATTGYQIQYATKSDFSNGALVYGGAANVTSKTITGRAANTTYYVRVRTYRTIGNNRAFARWSSAKSFKTQSDLSDTIEVYPELCSIYKGFAVTLRCKFSYAVDLIDGYEVNYKGTNTDTLNRTIYFNNNGTNVVKGLKTNTKYIVKVRAYTFDKNKTKVYSNWSSSKTITTSSFVYTPSIISVSEYQDGFSVKWTKRYGNDGYQIQYSTNSNFSGAATVTVNQSLVTEQAITGRAYNTTYYVRIRAFSKDSSTNMNVYSHWSDSKTIKTVSPPQKPTIKTVKSLKNGFNVTWNAQNDAVCFQLQYATKSDFSNAATIYAGQEAITSKSVTGRATNTTYYVRIRGYINNDGKYIYSPWSSAKTVKTLK